MKLFRYMLPITLGIVAFYGCGDDVDVDSYIPQPSMSDTSIKSILVYAEHPERLRDTLDVTFTDTRDALVFTTRSLPIGMSEVDLSKVHIEMEVSPNANVQFTGSRSSHGAPATPVASFKQIVDLTVPGHGITITSADGSTVSYAISTVVSEPYEIIPKYRTTITELWTKTGVDLDLLFPSTARDICVAGDYLLVLDNTIDYQAAAKIKAYNKYTGEFVKNVAIYEGGWAGPRSYSWTLSSDEAGHFAMGRLNSGGAGFLMDAYTDIDAVPTNPFWLADNQVPVNAGKRMQILGNLYDGSGYVCLTSSHFYGTVPMQGQYCTWTMTNGIPNSTEPNILSYPSMWYSAIVQRESLDDPTMYVTYNDESSYPSDPIDKWNDMHGAHFVVYLPGSADAPLEMNTKCFKYRILDSNVFHVKDARFFFTLQMGYSTGTSPMCTSLYNISGKAAFSTTPAAADYHDYMLYESAGHVSSNDLRMGSVAVWVDKENNTAYMYAFYPGASGEKAKITCLKMEVGDPIE